MSFLSIASADTLEKCILNLAQTPYTGTVSVTNHGINCKTWLSHYPGSLEENMDPYFPADGGVAGAKNYCRNLGGVEKPYCYTEHPFIDHGYCHLRICNGNAELGRSTPSASRQTLSLRFRTRSDKNSAVKRLEISDLVIR